MRVKDLLSQRDELAGALELLLFEVKQPGCTDPGCFVCKRWKSTIKKARAALAKVGK